LVNVLDLREKPYRWSDILAVAQNAAGFNAAEDGDKIPENGDYIQIDYAERDGVSVCEAILWAERLDGMITLTIYDREDAEA